MTTAQNPSPMMIGVLLVGAYLYLKKGQPGMVSVPKGAVPSMPGNIGVGWSQVAAGALQGFLSTIASGNGNNGSTPDIPSSYNMTMPVRAGVAQESASWGWDDVPSSSPPDNYLY